MSNNNNTNHPTDNLLLQALARRNLSERPPVWMMRQAGRYHSHYQQLRRQYSFLELCKLPAVACEVTLGPIDDFHFDAAILFSDLLFPLEVMGMGLSYPQGPVLGWHLESRADVSRLQSGSELARELQFQGEALKLIRARLPQEKGLLGFVGGPLTLFCYAVDGSHQGGLQRSHEGLAQGWFDDFCEKLESVLVANMVLQAQAGADAIAVLDTAAGDFTPEVYQARVVPWLKRILMKFRSEIPDLPLLYYSKHTDSRHWQALAQSQVPIQALGVDSGVPLEQVLAEWGEVWAIQGNTDPQAMLLPPLELARRLRQQWLPVQALPARLRAGWICGLGHGVLPATPEGNVHLFLRMQKEMFS